MGGMSKVYYRVKVSDELGNVNPYPSAVQSFSMVDSVTGDKVTFSGNAVSPTGLSASASKSAEGSSKLTFSWKDGSGSFGVFGYTLKVTVNGKTSTYTDIKATKYTLTDQKDGNYSWTVTANSGNDTSATSTAATFTVDATGPKFKSGAASSAKASKTSLTVKWDAATDASGVKNYVLQYGPGDYDKSTWYSTTVTTNSYSGKVIRNGNYNYRIYAVDNYNNVSAKYLSGSFVVKNAGPKAPTVKASTTAATNKNVTLTATFGSDSAKKQYSTDKATWKTYSKAISVGSNGTYYFRGVDAAGNVSSVTAYKVSNIDKTAPDAPTVKASTTKATNKNVTLTATFSSDSAKKQYSTDKTTWKTYSKAISVGKNGTYYFRGIDAAGNASTVKGIKVANIADTTNNTWDKATELKGTVLGALDPSVDKVDYYNVGDVAKLMLDMESGTAKLTFCDSAKNAVNVNVVCADSTEKTVSSLKLVAGDSVSDNISVADLDAVKYLKLESTTGSAGYKLAKLA